jgi:hypothetical protein
MERDVHATEQDGASSCYEGKNRINEQPGSLDQGPCLRADCPTYFLRELERLRRKNDALKREIKYALQAVDYAWKMVTAIRIERPEDWMAIDVVEDALARGEAEILAAYARRRLKRAARELAKEA